MNDNWRGTPEERFWAKVDERDNNGCWLWTAYVGRDGYGRLWVRAGRPGVLAHRFSWELVNGPVPEGKELDHLCWVKHCVNPDHLRAITRKQHKEHRRGPQRNSTSGILGVYFHKSRNKWSAQIKHHGKTIHGGRFDTAAEANEAVIALRQKYFTHNDWDG